MRYTLTPNKPRRMDQVVVGTQPGRDLRWRGETEDTVNATEHHEKVTKDRL